jgi:hypothetical protein
MAAGEETTLAWCPAQLQYITVVARPVTVVYLQNTSVTSTFACTRPALSFNLGDCDRKRGVLLLTAHRVPVPSCGSDGPAGGSTACTASCWVPSVDGVLAQASAAAKCAAEPGSSPRCWSCAGALAEATRALPTALPRRESAWCFAAEPDGRAFISVSACRDRSGICLAGVI